MRKLGNKKKISLNGINTVAFFNILGPVILNGINFFTTPIFTRLLGTESYGVVAIYTTWVQVFTVIIGLQTAGTIATSIVYIKNDEQEKYQSSILTLSMISLLCISVLTIIFIAPLSNFFELSYQVIACMLAQSFGSYLVNFAISVFTIKKEAHKTFLLSVITTISTIALSLCLIYFVYKGDSAYLGRIIGMAIPNIVLGLLMLIIFLYKGKTFVSLKYWKFCLPLCIPLIFHGLSHIILSQIDKVMLQKYVDDSTVGIYSLIFTVAHLLNIIWGALNNTWIPFYFEDIKNNNLEAIKHKTKNYMFLYTGLTVGFILVSPEVIKFCASSDYWSGINLLPVMALSMFMIFLYGFPVNFQFYYNNTKMISIGTMAAAAINFVLNALLIPKFGMMGAAVATLISYIALFVFHEVIARYVIKAKYHYEIKMYIPFLLAVIISIGVFYTCGWIIRWILAVFVGIAILYRVIKNKSIF